jgi:peptidoglycan/LPS O-acetylase OafA/YrhL
MVTQGSYLLMTNGGSADYDVSTYFKTFCFAVELPNILIGFCIYYLTQSTGRLKSLAIYGTGLILAVALFVVAEKSGLHVVSNRFPVSALLGGMLLLCILFCNGQKSAGICGRVLSTYGKYSLGIYLLHILIIKIYKATFGIECSSLITWIAGYLAVVIVSLICGYAAEKGINALIDRYKVAHSK